MDALIEIRPAQPADRESVHRVVEAAFGEGGSAVLELLKALDASERTQLSLLADLDGVVVGHIQLNRSWLDAREALVDVMVLNPLSVEPAHRGKGIGAMLIEAAMTTADREGCPAIFVEGARGYFGRRGFVRASARGFVRPSVRIPDAAFQVAVLDGHEDWMTGAVVYCDAFWELNDVGLRDPALAEVEQQGV